MGRRQCQTRLDIITVKHDGERDNESDDQQVVDTNEVLITDLGTSLQFAT